MNTHTLLIAALSLPRGQAIGVIFILAALMLICLLFGAAYIFRMRKMEIAAQERERQYHNARAVKPRQEDYSFRARPERPQYRKAMPKEEPQLPLSVRARVAKEDNTSTAPKLTLVADNNKPTPKKKRELDDSTAEEKSEFLEEHIKSSIVLVKEMTRRMNSLEMLMGDRMYLANQIVNTDLIHSRRIIRGIQERIRIIEEILNGASAESLDAAYELAMSDLEFPKDPINDLLESSPLDPIASEHWFSTLENLLSEAENQVQTAINQ